MHTYTDEQSYKKLRLSFLFQVGLYLLLLPGLTPCLYSLTTRSTVTYWSAVINRAQ